ncbi:MAG: ABC-2 family transporter protein [Chloroflexota bacterium]
MLKKDVFSQATHAWIPGIAVRYRLFWEITKRSLQRYMAYRAAAVAGLATNFFFGLLRMAILLALYGERQEVLGYTVQGIITYAALTQAVIGYLNLFMWSDLANSVHNGEVAVDLLKPMNYFSLWLAQDLGRAAVNLLLRGVTIMFIYALVVDLTYPHGLAQWGALALAIVLSWLISFGFRFLINLSAFWTPNARGIIRSAFVFSWFASGLLMPLRFFPDWVNFVIYLTPFPYMLNAVVEIYVGVAQGAEVIEILLIQLGWAVALIVAGQLLLRAGVRRLVILGG